jgi:hypothetical protein
MRSVNYSGGLTRIWIIFSIIYVITALFVLAENSDCVGYLDRYSNAQITRSVNYRKINELEKLLPKELLDDINRARRKRHSEFDDFPELNIDKPITARQKKLNQKLDQMRKKYSRFTNEISTLQADVFTRESKVGSCDRIFIWHFANKGYANVGTIAGTALGGLILLWGLLYVLLGIGQGLRWIKAGFIEETSSPQNEVIPRASDAEEKEKEEINIDIDVGKKPLLVERLGAGELDEIPDPIPHGTVDADATAKEATDWGTPVWAMKAIGLQCCAFLCAVFICAGITTYIIHIKAGTLNTLVSILLVASFPAVWQANRNLNRRLASFLFGSLAGVLAYLSTRALWLGLHKAGSLDVVNTVELVGISVALGGVVALGISYLINTRKSITRSKL